MFYVSGGGATDYGSRNGAGEGQQNGRQKVGVIAGRHVGRDDDRELQKLRLMTMICEPASRR